MTKKMKIELPDGVYVERFDEHPQSQFVVARTPEAAERLIERLKKAHDNMTKRPAGMPEEGQDFWYISANGMQATSWSSIGEDGDWCMNLWEIGNVFLTEAECIAEIDRRKALQRVKVWKAENLPHQARKSEYPDAVFELSVMKELSIPDQLRLIESCEADLRTLAGVE